MLGRSAEFVYGAAQWEPELVTLLRAGELIPIARQYPGAREFVESHRKEFPGADLSYHTAQAVRRLPGLRGSRQARGLPGRRQGQGGHSQA